MKKYITAKEAATLTDLATNTITLAAQQGLISGFKQYGKWFLLSQDVLELKKTPHKKGVKRERTATEVEELTQLGQISLFDKEATPAYIPKHAKVKDERDYNKIPLYTVEDLKQQYLLGFKAGIECAQDIDKLAEVKSYATN